MNDVVFANENSLVADINKHSFAGDQRGSVEDDLHSGGEVQREEVLLL